MPEVLTPSHLAYAVTVDVESPDVSRNSRQSEVLTQAGNPDTCGSAGRLSAHVGTLDVRRKFRPSEVPTLVGSPDTYYSAGWLFNCARRKSRRTSEVPTVGSLDVCREFRH